MTAPDEYFEYLKGRGRLGWLYRRYWLYPNLCRYLNGKALDIGCGIGDFLNYRTETVGVDINPATVEWCRHMGLDAQQMSPNVLPFKDASFDSAILDNVLEHLTEPFELLNEIGRVLRPRSSLVVGVPGRRGYATDSDHKVFYDELALVKTLVAAGFRLQHLFYMPIKSAWLDLRLRQYCLYGVFKRD
jgi:SAM-dependent methyltransferase